MTETKGYARKAIKERQIPYRPRFTELTGKVTAAILIQQVAFHWENVGGRPFYKFRAPCGHDMYREGDSWTEELGFSGSEFDTAIKTIGTKITKGVSREDAVSGTSIKSLVIYWTDSNRVTWYELNQPLFDKLTDPLYEDKPIANSGKLNYKEIQEKKSTRKSRKAEKHTSENTPEKTTKRKPTPKAKKPKQSEPKKEPDPVPGTVEPWRGPPPPAARVYQSRMNRWPRRTQYRRIHETVGNAPEDLEFFGEVVSKYDALGWNNTNVDGMLEWYERRELPHVTRVNAGNGNGYETRGERNQRIVASWFAEDDADVVVGEYAMGETL